MELLKNQIQEQSIAKFSSTNAMEQSGIAKRIDNLNRSEALETNAKQLEKIEEAMMLMFGVYINAELNYQSEYYKYYDIDDIQASLEETMKALSIQWNSNEVIAKIKERQLRKLFADSDMSELKQLIKLESETDEAQKSADAIILDYQSGNITKSELLVELAKLGYDPERVVNNLSNSE